MAELAYTETRYLLCPGDRLTFVSDGVVEATNSKRELFGFGRTQAMSTEPVKGGIGRAFGKRRPIRRVEFALRTQGFS